MSKPLVSIACITYNQENFIKDTLEGFLMQKTTFPIEIIVNDDASNDNTASIIKDYVLKYPNLIVPIFQLENQYSKGINPGVEFVLPRCSGKYIALCEGDDYWTDPFKLQNQVDFLESNPDFAICFHNAKIYYESEPDRIDYSNNNDQKEVTTFDDIAKGEYIYTATCVFRLNDFKKFPLKYYKYVNNYTLDLHNAQFGKIKYIDEVMSVYRVHPGGIWSMVSRLTTLTNQLPIYKFYVDYFNRKYRSYFITHLRNMTKEIIVLKKNSSDYSSFPYYFLQYLKYNIFVFKEWKIILHLIYKYFKFNVLNFLVYFKKGVKRLRSNPKKRRELDKIQSYFIPYLEKGISINIIDIGSHKGSFLEEILTHYKISKAILIEPMPLLADYLNTKYKGSEYQVLQFAISNVDDDNIEFLINEFSETSSLLKIKSDLKELEDIPTKQISKINIRTRRLDSVVSESGLSLIDLIKIDVQGAEHLVIEGGKSTLQKTKYVWCELSFKPLYEGSSVFQDIYDRLHAEGFRLLELSPGHRTSKRELLQVDALFVNSML
jgi:FkbM family methyltransferase